MASKLAEWLDYIRLAFMLLVTTLQWFKSRDKNTDELKLQYALDVVEHQAVKQVRRIETELGRKEAHNYMRDKHGKTYEAWLAKQTDEQEALANDPVELARRLARIARRDPTPKIS